MFVIIKCIFKIYDSSVACYLWKWCRKIILIVIVMEMVIDGKVIVVVIVIVI